MYLSKLHTVEGFELGVLPISCLKWRVGKNFQCIMYLSKYKMYLSKLKFIFPSMKIYLFKYKKIICPNIKNVEGFELGVLPIGRLKWRAGKTSNAIFPTKHAPRPHNIQAI